MKNILQKVDVERLFNHIKSIEGVRHHLADPKQLNEAADYILNEFQTYNLQTNDQVFKVEGTDMDFRNIEAYLGDQSKPEVLVTSHYDTVRTTPGANDNASAVAVMLEIARILSSEKFSGNVRFVSFTLEELHPTVVNQSRDKGLELGIFDEDYKYTSYHTQKMIKQFYKTASINISKGKSMLESWESSFEEIKEELTDSEMEFCKFVKENRKKLTRTSWIGKVGLVGSDHWVKEAVASNKKIKGVLNLDTVGYTSSRKHSQILPPLMSPLFFPSYKVKSRKRIGNFISIATDKNSKNLGKIFCKSCKHEDINLPYMWGKIPLGFDKIAKWIRDILRSDHAPFWREGIPALMLSDTANFRYPHYHTEADTIDKLNFDFIRKVAQATLATVIELSKIYNLNIVK